MDMVAPDTGYNTFTIMAGNILHHQMMQISLSDDQGTPQGTLPKLGAVYQGYQLHQISLVARTWVSGSTGQINVTFRGSRAMLRTQEFRVNQGQH